MNDHEKVVAVLQAYLPHLSAVQGLFDGIADEVLANLEQR